MRDNIIKSARNTLQLEADALAQLVGRVDDQFVSIVELILESKGRVVVTGIGKSANIAQKIVATFNSTGTPALFMHAADAIHGDLGLVQKGDVVICISKSGSSPEVQVLCPLVKRMGNSLIALTGNMGSFLAEQADYSIDASVLKEACPNDLAPTSSTTAQLAFGDALAVALMECRGFSSSDFAKYHPGGALGKRLFLKVSDLLREESAPQVQIEDNIAQTIIEISSKRLGATAVLSGDKVEGIVTDGDLRRMLEKHTDLAHLKAGDVMSANPKSISFDALAVDAFNTMEENSITQLMVISDGKYCGIVHLHDLLKEGIY